jgi:Protein of unknown function (DUF2845)
MRIWPLVIVVGLAAATPAHAFRCGSKLVNEGDTRSQVLAKCGPPTEAMEHAPVYRSGTWIHGRRYNLGYDIEVLVETWIYNLGPHKLMRRIRFEDGLVVEIETLGYGFREYR